MLSIDEIDTIYNFDEKEKSAYLTMGKLYN